MRLLRCLALVAALLAGVTGRADPLGEVRREGAVVTHLESAGRSRLQRRTLQERRSQALAAEIDQLKQRGPGVQRDLQLRQLLAQAKTSADELERIAAEERAQATALEQARRRLVRACDQALRGGQPESRRLELQRLRTAQVTQLATPVAPLQVVGTRGAVTADPLDSPRALGEKADLLRDSGDKLRREVQRLASRIDHAERRRHLRERAGAVDEDWFGESSSNRRVSRAATTATAPASSSGGASRNADSAQTADPTPAAGAPSAGMAPPPAESGSGFGGTTGTGGGLSDPVGGSSAGSVLRNLVDPAVLDELRRADGSEDVDRSLRALRRAQQELEALARDLDRRAQALDRRAKDLKGKK